MAGTVYGLTRLEVWSLIDFVKLPAGGVAVISSTFSSEETLPSTARTPRRQFRVSWWLRTAGSCSILLLNEWEAQYHPETPSVSLSA